ncbi:unnamed protein product [Protopolystoma xenopodis]|uniref:Uncharacterized protein n=1 Tax=Protopolystoma xenopodis TaxID=117903 RepID=A0A448XDQ2_9PLAT|nr:unnamed protein product [Protopolystoma xenopodis]
MRDAGKDRDLLEPPLISLLFRMSGKEARGSVYNGGPDQPGAAGWL